ncbi:MAG: hypothetical protein M1819_003687 [Sarea resinae]|nr:MAG: hypothetical protein M1819_003687 [Sarea resinae]
MHPPRLSIRRVPPLLRPFQPPNLSRNPRRIRLFTHNSQLLPVSNSTPRPQLPFLSPPSSRYPLRHRGGQWQISRLITTERKQYFKQQLWLAGKYTAVGWTGVVLLLLMAFGFQNEVLERKYPSPPEWSWISRMNYRNARGQEEPDANGTGLIDWASTGNMYRQLLRRLEDRNKDGAGLTDQEEGGILVPGVGRAGLDIESKPYAWRRGYYEAIMGAARAAEHLDGWVKDNTRNVAFPSDVVIGPSNPRPKPVPPGAKSAPREEDCSPAFEAPETYYMKILTTRGFTTKQRLEAALAYADWLDFKNLPDSAEEMYKWGLDIATSALPDPSAIIDPQTSIIRPDSPPPSSNVLLAATSLAIHHARSLNLSNALPIFLSVLRARRALPAPPPSATATTHPATSDSTAPSVFSSVLSFLSPPAYPPPPPAGDEPPFRTPASICEEAGLMAYIGEILFTSSSSNAGLTWTREAVDVAESTLSDLQDQQRPANADDDEGRERCSECLEVGLQNWSKMVAKLAREEKGAKAKSAVGGATSGWSSWVPFSGGSSENSEVREGKWARESQVVEERVRRVRELVDTQPGAKGDGGGTMLFGSAT